jgi:hypothetical protein
MMTPIFETPQFSLRVSTPGDGVNAEALAATLRCLIVVALERLAESLAAKAAEEEQ